MNHRLLVVAFLSLAACGKSEKKAAPAAAAPPAPAAAPAAPTAPAPTPAPAAAAPTPAAAPAAVIGSCMNPAKSQCTDYVGATATVEQSKGACDLISGAFTAGAPCPSDKRLGQCPMKAMGKTLSYYPGGEDELTAALAQEDCTSSGGTWAP
jgi:hypothetical protein